MAELYDHGWHEWADMKHYGPTSRHERRLIHQLLAPLNFTSVMDTGCGVGDLLLEMKERYPQVAELAGSEISKTAVEICTRRLPEAKLTLLDLQTDRVDQQYDLTVSVDVLEHIADDEAALRNIRAMTGKYFLAVTVQGNYLPEWEATVMGHVRNYRYGELQQKIKAAGFEIMQVIEWGFPFYSPLYRKTLTLISGQGAGGEYGLFRKTVAMALYNLFWLNSSRKGDIIMVLAKVPS